MDRESALEMALRHVAQGERHVEAQRRIIAHLRELGGSTVAAEQLLDEFEGLLAVHKIAEVRQVLDRPIRRFDGS